LDQNIQNVAILINCSPQILNAAIDLEEHFIKMPLVPGREDFRLVPGPSSGMFPSERRANT
jgi:hypothetical protein